MPTFPTTPFQTTLSAAMTASQATLKTVATTGFAVDKYLVIGKEVLLLTAVDLTSGMHSVKRGMKGSKSVAHASGAIVTLGAATVFGPYSEEGVVIAGYADGVIGCTPTLPIGGRKIDPDSGYEYLLCSSASAHVVGTWVNISIIGVSTILTNALKGRVGVVVEAPGAASKLHWVMVVGSYNAALFSHTAGAVTTATNLCASGTVPGSACAQTTCDLQQTRIYGASCTVALTTGSCPITGANPGTAYLNNPWSNGLTDGNIYTS